MAVTWKRNAGKIMCAGDSITVGFNALTGGWRKKLFADLATAGIAFTAVGPYSSSSPGMSATAHRGLSGDKASAAKTGLGAEVATADPDVIVYGFGMNDLGSGTSTAAQYLNDMDACIDAAQANVFFAVHLVQTLIRPTSPHSYFSNVSRFDTAQTDLPARVSAQGGAIINVGAPSLSDGVHPNDGASGFDAMATAIYNAILAAIP